MTEEFQEGLISGYERSMEIIKILTTDPKCTPEQALNAALDTIRIEMEAAERG